ncbi:SDR family NAD(P)-dependent oxidoreductase [Sodalis sp. RH15]|uniref:SDR family NAD(P)-dependent oxidoreductase n=1 Tax=Sodalis sp. RH15 TaxID=3394330 RepID=UPI0039B55C2E
MSKTILITGASSGFGKMTAYALADAGHTVYASMRDTKGRNAEQVAAAARHAAAHSVDLRTVELDVQEQASVDRAIQTVIDEKGGLDVLVHNAGHMVLGAAEGPTADLQDRVGKGHAAMEPKDADPQAVARAIASVVELPAGKRPFHITVDPADMGYEVMAAMGDRIRAEVMRAMGLGDILTPASA